MRRMEANVNTTAAPTKANGEGKKSILAEFLAHPMIVATVGVVFILISLIGRGLMLGTSIGHTLKLMAPSLYVIVCSFIQTLGIDLLLNTFALHVSITLAMIMVVVFALLFSMINQLPTLVEHRKKVLYGGGFGKKGDEKEVISAVNQYQLVDAPFVRALLVFAVQILFLVMLLKSLNEALKDPGLIVNPDQWLLALPVQLVVAEMYMPGFTEVNEFWAYAMSGGCIRRNQSLFKRATEIDSKSGLVKVRCMMDFTAQTFFNYILILLFPLYAATLKDDLLEFVLNALAIYFIVELHKTDGTDYEVIPAGTCTENESDSEEDEDV
jgi:hypothetical protein